MQKMGDTIITDLGMDLLSSVNNGDDKITYTKTVLAADDLTQESDVDIQKTTSLKLIQQTTGTTVISRVDDTVNLGATFTNKEVTQNFDFYVIGWYAKGSAVITDERLFAITPSTVKQTMPAGKDGAATAAISPKYASALSRSATVSLNPDQAGTVTPEYVDQKIQQIISEGIVNAGSTLSESDNLDSFITTGYHLIKGSLPLSAPEGFSTNGQIIVYGNKDTTDGVTQVAYDDINGTSYVRSYNPTNNKWAEWDLVITKSQLNAVLPTDIARTGENNDFKGKNTFETDPTDGAGNAYAKTIDVNQQLDTKVTDNKNGTITANNLSYDLSKTSVTPIGAIYGGSFNDLPLGTVFVSSSVKDGPDTIHAFTTTTFYFNGLSTGRKAQIAIADSINLMYFRVYAAPTWNSWVLLSDDSKVVHSTDMRKSASDVAGIEEVNAKQDKIGYTPADDSKVVHSTDTSNWQKQKITNDDGTALVSIGDSDDLSAKISSFNTGFFTLYYSANCANNPSTKAGRGFIEMTYSDKVNGSDGNGIIFDEDNVAFVVTVLNSNVTYSRLASLSGTNNFDKIPTVDNNPLLLASSLPSDLARTGQANTFTQPQTFSIAPVINDASTDKGDNQAATMADLKSVENSAWHQLSMPDCNGMNGITLLYRNFISDHYMNLYAYGTGIQSNIQGPTMLDLSSLIDNIESVSGMARDLTVRMSSSIFRDSLGEETLVDLVASGNKLTLGTNATIFMAGPVQINGHDSPFAKVTYDNWIGS